MSICIENLALNLNYKEVRDDGSVNEFESVLSRLLKEAISAYDVENHHIGVDIEHINIDFPTINSDDFLIDPEAYFLKYLLPKIQQGLEDQGLVSKGNRTIYIGENTDETNKSLINTTAIDKAQRFLLDGKPLGFADFSEGLKECLKQDNSKQTLLTVLQQQSNFQRFATQFWNNSKHPMAKELLQSLLPQEIASSLLLVTQQSDGYGEILWSLAQQLLQGYDGYIDQAHWQLSVGILFQIRQSKVSLANTQWQSLISALVAAKKTAEHYSGIWLKELSAWLMVNSVQKISQVEINTLLNLAETINSSQLPIIYKEQQKSITLVNSGEYISEWQSNQVLEKKNIELSVITPENRSLRQSQQQHNIFRKHLQQRLALVQRLQQLSLSKESIAAADLFDCINELLFTHKNLPVKWRLKLASLSTVSFSEPAALNLAIEQLDMLLQASKNYSMLVEGLASLIRLTGLPVDILLEIQQLLLDIKSKPNIDLSTVEVRDSVNKWITYIASQIKQRLLREKEMVKAVINYASWKPLVQKINEVLVDENSPKNYLSNIDIGLILVEQLFLMPVALRYLVLRWLKKPNSQFYFESMLKEYRKFEENGIDICAEKVKASSQAKLIIEKDVENISCTVNQLEILLEKMVSIISQMKSQLEKNDGAESLNNQKSTLPNNLSSLSILQELLALELFISNIVSLKEYNNQSKYCAKLKKMQIKISQSLKEFYCILPEATVEKLRLQTWKITVDNSLQDIIKEVNPNHVSLNIEDSSNGSTIKIDEVSHLKTLDTLQDYFNSAKKTLISNNAFSATNLAVALQAKQQAVNHCLSMLEGERFDELTQPLQQQLDHLTAFTNMSNKDSEQNIAWDTGVLLFYPFLTTLFQKLKLLDTENQWLNSKSQDKAVALLICLYGGGIPELPPACSNLLVGRGIDEAYPLWEVLTQQEQKECDNLLANVIQHWQALKNMSAETFRELFVVRSCTIDATSQGYAFVVEPQPQDILLYKLPWGLGIVRLPWLGDTLLDIRWNSGL